MPHIREEKRREGDRVTVRQVFERRYPKDVVPILGRRFIHKWPIGITRQQAGDDPSVPTEFQRRIEEARADRGGSARYIHYGDPCFGGGSYIARHPQTSQFIAGVEVPMGFDIVAHLKAAFPQSPSRTSTATNDRTDPETVIKIWKGERIAAGNEPDDKAIDAKRSKMRDLFDWLRTHHGFVGDDMPAVSLGLLNRYKEYLIDRGQAEDKPTLTHEHLHEIKFLYKVADRNPGLHGARFPNGNPAEKLHIPPKPEHIPTKAMPDQDARKILLDSRKSNGSIIQWGHWLACFNGCIISELVMARKSEFKQIGGQWIFDMTERRVAEMKTGYRPRGIPIHPSVIREGFIDWLQSRPDGRIFDVDATRASRLLMEHIRGLGIEDVIDHDAKIVGHKIFKSWRTRFCSRLEDVTTPDRARYLAGHAAKDVHAKHYLEHELEKLVAAIEGLDDPTLEKAA